MHKKFNVTSGSLTYREDFYGNKLWFINYRLVFKCKVNGGKVWYDYYEDGTLKHMKDSKNGDFWYSEDGNLIKHIS